MLESKPYTNSARSHLPIITCSCGYEILILPNLKIMSQAIENHVLEHKNKGASNADAKEIENELINQIFNNIAQSDI